MIVGFDRRIRVCWLDATARLAAQGLSVPVMRDRLNDLLDGQVSGDSPQSARGKTRTVLLRIWVTVPNRVVPLRDEAVTAVADGDIPDLRPLHWGMCLASYPFFRDVASITGRLLSLQRSVTLAAVNRRITERYGARSTVLRASQRVVRSMVDWGVLKETRGRGVFGPALPIDVHGNTPHGTELAGWLIEAALLASGRDSMRLGSLARHPMLFPFKTGGTARDVLARTRLEFFREGAGEEVVGWRYGS